MTRKEARDFMMKVLFQMESAKDYDVDNKHIYFKTKEDKLEGQKDYCDNIYSLFCNKKEIIDKKISKYSKWNLQRVPKVDLAVLRLSTIELKFMKEIPHQVVINEAVEISKRYGNEESPKYVNAILSNVLKTIDEDEQIEQDIEFEAKSKKVDE